MASRNIFFSGALSRVLVAPLDVLKIRLQVMLFAVASHRDNLLVFQLSTVRRPVSFILADLTARVWREECSL